MEVGRWEHILGSEHKCRLCNNDVVADDYHYFNAGCVFFLWWFFVLFVACVCLCVCVCVCVCLCVCVLLIIYCCYMNNKMCPFSPHLIACSRDLEQGLHSGLFRVFFKSVH